MVGRGGGGRTEVVAALLALFRVYAETRGAVARRDALDVARAKGFDAAGSAAGGLFGVKGLAVVEEGGGGEADGRCAEEEGVHRVCLVDSVKVGGCK